MQTLRDLQQRQGAILDADLELPITFGNDTEALDAVNNTSALVDRSHWGTIQITGRDRLRFIHNQTTNTFTQRQSGEGCDTVFVTSTARTIDLATVYVEEESLLILTSPGQDQHLIDWMDRYIFPADQVSLLNLTEEIAGFSLIGPDSLPTLNRLGIHLSPALPYGHHQSISIGDISLKLAVGSGLALPGYTLFVAATDSPSLWEQLVNVGAVPTGEALWQQLRIQQGRPAPKTELNEDYNPLEAGLWQAISFDKGCYIGQETIARLNTYQGVKQQLWGVELNDQVEAGTPMMLDGNIVGRLTSVVATRQGYRGLSYLRTKVGKAGLEVDLGTARGSIVDLPFLSRGYLSSNTLKKPR
ncbi:folate-binding protein YgfZ [Nodosilinea sp. LEGE 07088]|uniref:CAF17-like 4Fe-4S cluster assembly/insertion protein YgfZ n=1 Tax=Nodosilinea sp. LEGE 07088 TaxID=2777968 RepID=UPI0018830C96|nr:folate-binding protein YgfZ [Nodosilinea sp. LEGE 07088]MBE9136222.1 folate-binding protein YgfZ [Nodosilinea sp. LEGE 07088]